MLVRMLPLSLALLLVGCANATAPPSPNGPPATGGSLPIGSRPAPATALALPLSQNDASPPGVVSLVNVPPDRVADVSSLEAWQRSFIQDGMSDADKAQAIWRSVVAFRHQAEPPRELIEYASHPHDPIRMFNVYG